MSQIGMYAESWSATWSGDSNNLLNQLTTGSSAITVVNIAFAQPDNSYVKGQNSFANTGLEFSDTWAVVVGCIKAMTTNGIKVMLSVGGGSYWSTPKTLNVAGCIALYQDLGCTGIDVDWEVGVSDAASLTAALTSLHNAGCARLSFAGFSTGAYGPSTGDTYKGMSIPAMEACGSFIDWINIMAYDAGSSYDPLGAFTCYRIYYKGPLNIGFEPGTQSWGDKVIQMTDIDAACNWVKKDGRVNGVFFWSNKKDTGASPAMPLEIAEVVKIFGSATTTTTTPVTSTPTAPISSSCACPNCQHALNLILA